MPWTVEDMGADGILVGDTTADTYRYYEKADLEIRSENSRLILEDISGTGSEDIMEIGLGELSLPVSATLKIAVTTIKGYL